ncbi:hypothetical protein F5880DRAFT_1608068 [Lentinula raphanica]|nr:hypothetical protein F5880DRAFT_1608068 [Lentinula raphanica]
MRIINTFLPLVTLAVHVAGLPISGDGGSLSKRSGLGPTKVVERRGPHAIASRSAPDPSPGGYGPKSSSGGQSGTSDPAHPGHGPSTDNLERRAPVPNPRGGSGGASVGGGHNEGGSGSYNLAKEGRRHRRRSLERRAPAPNPRGAAGGGSRAAQGTQGDRRHQNGYAGGYGKGNHYTENLKRSSETDDIICQTDPGSQDCNEVRQEDVAKRHYRRRIDSWSDIENLD